MSNEEFAKKIRQTVEANVRQRSNLREDDVSTLGDIAEQAAMEMAQFKDDPYTNPNSINAVATYEKISKYGGCLYVSGLGLASLLDGQNVNVIISKL